MTHTSTEREDYFEHLDEGAKITIVLWSGLLKKRFYVFETLWNRGMASKIAFKTAAQKSRKEVKQFWKENHIKIK